MSRTLNDSSSIAGYISILFWFIVFIPQLQENYQRKNGDGLSLTFLYIWLAGDIFNLIGIIMERLIFTMFLLALWYAVADIGLIWQVIYYKKCCVTNDNKINAEAEALVDMKNDMLKKRRISLDKPTNDTLEMQQLKEETFESDNEAEDDIEINMIKPIWINLIGSCILVALIIASCYAYFLSATHIQEEIDDESIRLMPQIMGWLSAVLYVGSRVPQLIKNCRQQNTNGLSRGMFICAVFGNAFFAMSIFLKSTERRYIIVNLPWIIGSLGTVVFDVMIFLQFYVFERRKLKTRAD